MSSQSCHHAQSFEKLVKNLYTALDSFCFQRKDNEFRSNAEKTAK